MSRHYVTVRVGGGKPMFLRGGARMYVRSMAEAAVFSSLADAQASAEDLRRLLRFLPGRGYVVGTLSVSGKARNKRGEP